jgi:hypothetical protein
VAAVFHVLNHATFKASLFMIAGIVDHETHSRDMRQLGGLYKFMPWTATLSMVAAASMAGVPLTNGFLSKEMFFTEAVVGTSGHWAWLVPAAVTLAGICSVAYSLRFVHDTYFNGPLGDVPHDHPHEPPLGMKLPAILLVILCIAVGLLPALTFGPLVDVAARAVVAGPLPDYHLALWHGFNLPLLMSVIALVAGIALYAWLARGKRLHRISSEAWFGSLTGRRLFEATIDGVFGMAGRISVAIENGSLQRYLACFVGTAIVVGAAPLWYRWARAATGQSFGDRRLGAFGGHMHHAGLDASPALPVGGAGGLGRAGHFPGVPQPVGPRSGPDTALCRAGLFCAFVDGARAAAAVFSSGIVGQPQGTRCCVGGGRWRRHGMDVVGHAHPRSQLDFLVFSGAIHTTRRWFQRCERDSRGLQGL